jgi:putative transposase
VTIAPSGYYAAKSRPPSPRQLRDKELTVVLTGLWEANYRVYGARKLCRAARRAGHQVGRDQVGRLMKAAGLRGVRRGRQVFTTRPDRSAERHPDLVKRDFTATGPNQLWVTDLTYIPTWAGVAYVCFIIDVFSRMIVGWRVGFPYAHRHGVGRDRDGPLEPRRPHRRFAVSFRRGVTIHQYSVR